tara:strand:- start:3344 stop:3571 length:228 start_codon:yes stop_codon:yes gene_type:complete
MGSEISIKFNKLIDAWLHLKKIDMDWHYGSVNSNELFDCEWYQYECELDLLRQIQLEIFLDEVGEGGEASNPFDI